MIKINAFGLNFSIKKWACVEVQGLIRLVHSSWILSNWVFQEILNFYLVKPVLTYSAQVEYLVKYSTWVDKVDKSINIVLSLMSEHCRYLLTSLEKCNIIIWNLPTYVCIYNKCPSGGPLLGGHFEQKITKIIIFKSRNILGTYIQCTVHTKCILIDLHLTRNISWGFGQNCSWK